MKIGVVLNQYPVSSETFIQSFLGHLTQHEVYLFTNLNGSTEIKPNWRVRPYLNRFPYYQVIPAWLSALVSILLHFKRFKILQKKGVPLRKIVADASIWTTPQLDILHFPFGNNAIGREHYASLLGAKMTVSFRGSDINVYPVYHSRSYKSIWPYVHAVHCNSRELAIKLKEHDIPSNIPVSIITAALRPELNIASPVKIQGEPTGTEDNPVNIITLGRLHWIKDYPFAFRVMARLKSAGIKFRYFVLGDGPDKEQLLFLRRELDLEKEVVLAGKVSASEIRRFFSRVNIYLQTSYAEGFSNACLEAQAFGIPCVVPSVSGMDACVENGKTGLVIRSREENEFVDAITYILENPQSFDSQYISGRVKSGFSIEKQREVWLSFFGQFQSSLQV